MRLHSHPISESLTNNFQPPSKLGEPKVLCQDLSPSALAVFPRLVSGIGTIVRQRKEEVELIASIMKEISETPCSYLEVAPIHSIQVLRSQTNQAQISEIELDFKT